MGLRFFRRFTILPGIRINVGKQGISASVGPRGASLTLGKRGVFANVGLPGTGLSYRTRLDRSKRPQSEHEEIVPTEFKPEERVAPDSSGWALLQYEYALSNILRDREQGVVDWHSTADPGERPEDDGSDEFFEFARRLARARVAKRVLDGDDAAWAEALYEELSDEVFPFGFDFDFEIEEDGHVRLAAYLPDFTCIPERRTELPEDDRFRYRRAGKKESQRAQATRCVKREFPRRRTKIRAREVEPPGSDQVPTRPVVAATCGRLGRPGRHYFPSALEYSVFGRLDALTGRKHRSRLRTGSAVARHQDRRFPFTHARLNRRPLTL